ncbi:UNVERIFIED_CONTAM: hypothetical protein Sangu_2269100 [Sesamum angustifolium]|uniref:Uncharacterized protein n=1 Tax=Sesamum angustifolium TaxID=2727405 RepID=A0AAW2L6P5_9LAMI
MFALSKARWCPEACAEKGYGSEMTGSRWEFHLFCCQWMPEVYLENTRTMEPIMNMDELKDTEGS